MTTRRSKRPVKPSACWANKRVFLLSQASLNHGKQRVLHDISVSISEGEKVALIGPSGAGKSSLLSLLWEQHPADIALCPQDNALVDILSVYQNIYMGALSRFGTFYNLLNLIRPWPARRREVSAIAAQLGIADKLMTSPDQLSGGQRQRVALGRALYRKQNVFFGDEPVSSLDPAQGDALLGDVLSLHSTAVVAIHSPELALRHFTRIIALQNGRIVGDWPASSVSLEQLSAIYSGG